MPKLHANGLAVLKIGAAEYSAGADGMLDVAHEHVQAALTHGARLTPPAAPAPAVADRLAALEARVAALEAAPKKGR